MQNKNKRAYESGQDKEWWENVFSRMTKDLHCCASKTSYRFPSPVTQIESQSLTQGFVFFF